MGTDVRLYVGIPAERGLPAPEAALERVEAELLDFDRRLSRFRADSELCRLNASRSERVPASPLLREAVRAGLWGAGRTAGLVDPTLLRPLRALGYAETREGVA